MHHLNFLKFNLLRDVLLIFTLIVYAAGVIFYSLRSDPSSHGDWLVHYGEGFVRRGLTGELLLRFSEISGIPPQFVVPTLQIALFAALSWLLRNHFLDSYNLGSVALLLTPGAFLYLFAEPSIIGRKETLTLLIVAWTLLAASNSRTHLINGFAVAGGWLVAFLSHESSFALFPAVLYTALAKINKSKGFGAALAFSAPGMVSFLGSVFLIYTSASSGQNYPLCNRVLKFGYNSRVCDGGLEYVNQSTSDLMSMFEAALSRTDSSIYLVFFISAFLAALWIGASQGVKIKVYLAVMALLSSGIVALALIASDWGRWLHLFTVVAIMTAISLSEVRVKIRAKILAGFIAFFISVGYAFNGGGWMSPLMNIVNIGYYINGGMYGSE